MPQGKMKAVLGDACSKQFCRIFFYNSCGYACRNKNNCRNISITYITFGIVVLSKNTFFCKLPAFRAERVLCFVKICHISYYDSKYDFQYF